MRMLYGVNLNIEFDIIFLSDVLMYLYRLRNISFPLKINIFLIWLVVV